MNTYGLVASRTPPHAYSWSGRRASLSRSMSRVFPPLCPTRIHPTFGPTWAFSTVSYDTSLTLQAAQYPKAKIASLLALPSRSTRFLST